MGLEKMHGFMNLPGTYQQRITRCEVCSAPATEEHRPTCNVALAVCCHCKRPVVRANARPTSDIVTCGHCGHRQIVPSTFCRRLPS